MQRFYKDVLSSLLSQKLVDRSMKVLVVCGGSLDKQVFESLGFTDVTISNIDKAVAPDTYQPFPYSLQDAENLAYPDNEFDFVVVHSGLHHCYSPHRSLLEMYRVAKRGLLAVEGRDSLLMRCAAKLLWGVDYEITAVLSEAEPCGVAGTSVPNYVYRWTEREIVKTISSNAPQARHLYRFFHRFDIPFQILKECASRPKVFAAKLLSPLVRLLTLVIPGQGNRFAFYVGKPSYPQDLHPWMTIKDGEFVLDKRWTDRHMHSQAGQT